MENKNNGGLIAVIVFLLAVLLGVIFYVANNKELIFNNDNKVEDEEVSTNMEEELDINSRLVQSLYNKVKTSANGSCLAYWEYGDKKDEFYAATADEYNKMKIVGNNLNEHDKIYISCPNTSIPDIQTTKEGNKRNSVCAYNKLSQNSGIYKSQYAYSKEYVENIYKEIYGKDAVLNTAIPIEFIYGVETYYYVPSLQQYVLYIVDGGGTCGPGGTTGKIAKAIKIGTEIKIYEEVTEKVLQENDTFTSTEHTVVYTFKLEDDGMYSFHSRVKQ